MDRYVIALSKSEIDVSLNEIRTIKRMVIKDTKTSDNKEDIEYNGFWIGWMDSEENPSTGNRVLWLQEENEQLLKSMLDTINEEKKYLSLEDFVKEKGKFYSKKIMKSQEIGAFGELFYIYKSNKINKLKYLNKKINQTIDLNSNLSSEIKTTISLEKTFEIKFPQATNVDEFVFVNLVENEDGKNINELIQLIENTNPSINYENLNKYKRRFLHGSNLSKFSLKKSSYIAIEKNKLKLPSENEIYTITKMKIKLK